MNLTKFLATTLGLFIAIIVFLALAYTVGDLFYSECDNAITYEESHAVGDCD